MYIITWYQFINMMCKNLISFDFKVQTMFCSALLMFEYFFVEGATLLEIKKSFRDVDNVLYDWTASPSSDYCAWRGISCDNVTFNVVALWVTVSLDIVYRLLHFFLVNEKQISFAFSLTLVYFAAIFQGWILMVKFHLQ